MITPGSGSIVSHDGGTLINQDGSSYRILSTPTKAVLKLPGNRVMVIGS